jgi:glycosyltransferase involved in cell wall biosynthesis
VVVYAGVSGYDERLLGEAFVEVARSDPSALLLLTAPASAVLDGIVRRAGLAGRTITTGFVPYERLGEVLACGDVMLAPFTNRPANLARYPNKLGDYLAAGRPVVTNPTGEIGRFVESERVGLAAAETPEAFAAAVLGLLREPERRAEMGRRARAAAETHLSWTRLADRLEAVYLDVLKPGPKAGSATRWRCATEEETHGR